jgi:hypothetical protein
LNTLRPLGWLVVLAGLLPVGCSRPSVDVSDSATRQQLSLLMPATVNIVGPFTRFRGADDRKHPAEVELLLQPVNAFGDPVNIAGTLIVELYEFRQASGDDKGTKLQQWDIALTTERDQQTYWNRTTSMYEFRLQLGPASPPSSRKFVLQVIYNTPLKEHMIDQYVLEVPLATPVVAGAGG